MNKNIYNRYAIHDNIQQFTFVLAVGTFPLATRKNFSDERNREQKRRAKKESNKMNDVLEFCFVRLFYNNNIFHRI